MFCLFITNFHHSAPERVPSVSALRTGSVAKRMLLVREGTADRDQLLANLWLGGRMIVDKKSSVTTDYVTRVI